MEKDWKDEAISAFAFNTGREIEKFINERNSNLVETNMLLEGKILTFAGRIKFFDSAKDLETAYREFFGIELVEGGSKL